MQDPWEKNEPGLGLGRDPERTPMQWDASPHAGFTTGTPWLPLHDDWQARNLAAQRDDPRSIWHLYRDLLALRRAHPALSVGDWLPIECSGCLLAYERRHQGERLLVQHHISETRSELFLSRELPTLQPTRGGRALPGGGAVRPRARRVGGGGAAAAADGRRLIFRRAE